jgi:nucleoside-diphosphate-sugar epimerase
VDAVRDVGKTLPAYGHGYQREELHTLMVGEAFIMPTAKRKILVTGSSGQIGSELVSALRERYGTQNVVACDIKPLEEGSDPFELVDVTDREALEGIIRKYQCIKDVEWQKLFATEPYQRLKLREAAIAKRFNAPEIVPVASIVTL